MGACSPSGGQRYDEIVPHLTRLHHPGLRLIKTFIRWDVQPGAVYYSMQQLEQAATRRWGSEKEFKREQLRREIKRRRQELRMKSSTQVTPDKAQESSLPPHSPPWQTRGAHTRG